MAKRSQKQIIIRLVFILVLTIFSLLVDVNATGMSGEGVSRVPNWVPASSFWNKFDYHLGLDLKGGTHLIYSADVSAINNDDRESAVEGVRDVIERRVNAFGVSEPIIQTNQTGSNNYRIIAELAGVSDVNQAIEMIGKTPLLEFKKLNPNYEAERVLTPEQQQELDQMNADVKARAEEVLARVLAGEDFAELAREYSEDPGSADKGGDVGWATKGVFVPEYEKAIFEDLLVGEITPHLVQSQFGYHIIKKLDERETSATGQLEATTDSGETIQLDASGNQIEEGATQKEVKSSHILFLTKTADDILPPIDQWINTELSGKYLKRSYVTRDQNTLEWQVNLEFDSEGADLFEEITEQNIGKPIAIFLDGVSISAPNVNEKITGGQAVITGRFNQQEAKELVQNLNAGALPVPIKLISQQTVGPTLGKVSVEKSLWAGTYGLLAVALFMILVYRLPGFLSVVALAIYTLVVLAIFKIAPVTLTLAGIAGFILSIGMAVDANVLIFERFNEELKNGRHFSGSVEEGFKRAWTSIRDSNVSSLLTCAILYWFGTSVIRGFAVTLGIGILVSMFSAIVVTRTFLRSISPKLAEKHSRLLFGVKTPKK